MKKRDHIAEAESKINDTLEENMHELQMLGIVPTGLKPRSGDFLKPENGHYLMHFPLKRLTRKRLEKQYDGVRIPIFRNGEMIAFSDYLVDKHGELSHSHLWRYCRLRSEHLHSHS